jgi:hypothetical protein
MPEPKAETVHPWKRGAALSALGVIVGIGSLGWFCHALGLNFSDEGWSDSGAPWQDNFTSLAGSCIGFVVATLLFWLGFFQTTRR